MIKTTVGEFRQFLAADYGRDDDGWFEDIAFYRDGHGDPMESDDGIFNDNLDESLPANEQIKFEGGIIVFPLEKGREALSVEPLFKRWRKEQTTVTVLVQMPKDRQYAIETAISNAGGRVL